MNKGDQIAALALTYEGYPFVHGTHGPDSFDSSGFTKFVLEEVTGKWTPASPNDYLTYIGEIGQTIPLSQARPGDVLCFGRDDLPAGKCGHVGIWYSPNMMIQAEDEDSGVVRTDIRSPYYTSHLLCARRFYPYIDEPAVLPTGIRNPLFDGQKLAIVSASPGPQASSGAARAWDGDTGTSWYTTGTISSSTTLFATFNLGQVLQVSGIGWDNKIPEGMREFDIRVRRLTTDPWTLLGTFQAGEVGSIYGVACDQAIQYVQITIRNPTNAPVIGYLRELSVWGYALTSLPKGTLNPTFGGQETPVVSSVGSSNGSGSALVWDGNPTTDWKTVGEVPTSGFFQLDLGSLKSLTGIKWLLIRAEMADQFEVATLKASGGTWETVGTFSGGAPGEWRGIMLNRTGRYIRFTFSNPANRAAIGGIAEVRVWAESPIATWTHRVTERLNLRTGPSTTQTTIAVMPAGTRLRLLNPEPTNAGGFTWFNVVAEGFDTGWCVNGFEPIP